MTRYVAFLRAINVTGRYVKMDRLRAAFEGLGVTGVETFIQSGNVLFDVADDVQRDGLVRRIEQGLHEALGFEVPTILRTGEELAALLASSPFDGEEGDENRTLYVAFLAAEPIAGRRQRLLALESAVDSLHLSDLDLFWLYRREQGKSAITNARIERLLRVPSTVRNISTVRQIAAKIAP